MLRSLAFVSLCSAAVNLTDLACSRHSCSHTACHIAGTWGGCKFVTKNQTSVCTGNFSFDCQGLAQRMVDQQMASDLSAACGGTTLFFGPGCHFDTSNASFPVCRGTYTPYATCSEVPLAFCNESQVWLLSGDRCYSNGTACLQASSCAALPVGTECANYTIANRQCNQSSSGCVDGILNTCANQLNQGGCDNYCGDAPFGLHCRWDALADNCGLTSAPTKSPTPQPTRPTSPTQTARASELMLPVSSAMVLILAVLVG